MRKEIGLPIYRHNSDFCFGNMYIGTRSSVAVQDGNVGELHTHPRGMSEISGKDIYVMLAKDYDYVCIAGFDGVACYVPTKSDICEGLRIAVKRNYEEIKEINRRAEEYNRKVAETGRPYPIEKATIEFDKAKVQRKKEILESILMVSKQKIVSAKCKII